MLALISRKVIYIDMENDIDESGLFRDRIEGKSVMLIQDLYR
jgi:hypothetical protein